jgi:predicted RNA methylase
MILEQYPTSAHMAAHMLTTIHEQYDDLEGECRMILVVDVVNANSTGSFW